MRGSILWVLFFLVAIGAFFAYQGCDLLFNPHLTGYVTRRGHHVRFDDNGDRFIHAIFPLAIAAVAADGVRRLISWERKDASDRRWSWKVSVDGQMVERPGPTEDSIRADMEAFDGKLVGCLLTDRNNGSRIWCYGEPQRRIVEMSQFSPSRAEGMIARDHGAGAELVQLNAPGAVNVPASAVLTVFEALEVLLAFFRGKPIPPPFALLPAPIGLPDGSLLSSRG